jgi:16S rRNA processing protein RimM
VGEDALLDVGRVVKAHGLRGEVVVDLWSDFTERLDPGAVLQSDRGDLVVVASHPHQARWLVTFEGITTREAAERLHGVVLRAEHLEDPDAIWIHELFGCEVVDAKGVVRGRVVAVEANPASDLMVLEDGTLVPLAFVTEVEAHTRVVVDAPEGIFP